MSGSGSRSAAAAAAGIRTGRPWRRLSRLDPRLGSGEAVLSLHGSLGSSSGSLLCAATRRREPSWPPLLRVRACKHALRAAAGQPVANEVRALEALTGRHLGTLAGGCGAFTLPSWQAYSNQPRSALVAVCFARCASCRRQPLIPYIPYMRNNKLAMEQLIVKGVHGMHEAVVRQQQSVLMCISPTHPFNADGLAQRLGIRGCAGALPPPSCTLATAMQLVSITALSPSLPKPAPWQERHSIRAALTMRMRYQQHRMHRSTEGPPSMTRGMRGLKRLPRSAIWHACRALSATTLRST